MSSSEEPQQQQQQQKLPCEDSTTTGESDVTIEAKTQIKAEDDTPGSGAKKQESVALVSPTQTDQSKGLVEIVDMDVDDDAELDPRKQQWSESLKARLFGAADKDGNYFSFMFLDKIFGETRPCVHCGARGSAKVPPGDNSLQLFVIEEGIIGSQNIMCEKCGKLERVVSGDDPSLMPQDPRLIIKGMEIRDNCRKITHYEVLHDLMEMLHIAAMDDGISRKEKHSGVAAFMLHNARKICEEWCRPEHAELRLRKYLRLREETLLTKYKPTFTPDCTEEFKEMYEMMAQSFRQNRADILIILQLLKESLIDSPSRSNFMMWLSMAMMHSENYPQFKRMYDPRSFMRVESTEYQEIHERYLSLDAPVGIKKIPIIFVLFEIPRFYHYVDFLNQRLGKRKPRIFLTDNEKAELKVIEEEAAKSGVGRAARKRGKKTKTMVSPEAHLDFLTQQEDIDRERVYQSCRDKKTQSDAELGLGIEVNPKSIQAAAAALSKKPQKNTPLSIQAGSVRVRKSKGTGAGGSEEAGEEGLTKAQIKRRRKRALANSMKTTEGLTGVDDDLVGAGTTSTPVTKATTVAKEGPVAKATSKGKAAVTEDKAIVTKDKAAVTKDKATVTKDNASVTKDKASVAKDKASVSKDKPTVDKDKATVAKDRATVVKDEATVTKDKEAVFKEVTKNRVSPLDSHPLPPHATPDFDDEEEAKARAMMDLVAQFTQDTDDDSSEETEELSPEKMKLLEKIIQNMDIDTLRQTMEELEADYQAEKAGTKPASQSGTKRAASKPSTKVTHEEELSPIALAERAKMEAALLEAVMQNPVALHLSEKDRIKLSSNLAASSYPVVADLLEFANSLASPLPATPTEPKKVSVLLDPFNLYRDGTEPSGNHIAFVKTKNTVRPPSECPATEKASQRPAVDKSARLPLAAAKPDKAQQNIQDPLQARLAKVVAENMDEEEEDKEDLGLDYYSLEVRHLPPSLQDVVRRVRGAEMEPSPVTESDLKAMMVAVEKYGIPHEDVRHEDTESLVCFPSEAKVREAMSKGLEDEDPEVVPQIKYTKRRPDVKQSGQAGPRAGKPSGAKKPKAAPSGLDYYNVQQDQEPMGRNASRRAKREALKNAKKTLKNPNDHQAIMVTQMDTELLRRQGYKVDTRYPKATVVANRDGAIIHVLDGQQTPQQVKEFLSKRYSIVAQQAGPGYVTMPTKDHPGGLLVDPKYASNEDIPSDKFSGNRKKLRSKKKAIHEKQCSSLTRWPVPRPKNPYSIPLGYWATQDGPWPEGLDYGTEYHSDREIICESDDEELVKAIDKDEFGNHSMLMRLELSTVDVPNEESAETVMNRYMEPADLGPGIDPKVPRYIIPSNGVTPAPSKKLPAGTTKKDIPFIMKYAAPHKQMRAMDAMKIPYKYELTQVLTPHLNKDGEVVPDAPKRRALMSKITLLPKSRYRSLNPQPEEEEEKEEEKEDPERKEDEDVPKISKSQRKKMKKKQKLADQGQDSAFPLNPPDFDDLSDPLDPDEVVHSKLDPPRELGDEGSGSDSSEGSHLSAAARSKLKYCDNCGQEINLSRVQACAGCKRVAYCNFRCQKASWKVHKKTCSYALKKDGKESTG